MYGAMFAITHCTSPSALDGDAFKDITSRLERKAHIIVHVALRTYVQDVLELVKAGVTEDSARRLAEDPDDDLLADRVKVRTRDLASWLNDSTPLDFGKTTLSTLIRVVNFLSTANTVSLPVSSIAQMSVRDFAIRLFDLAGPSKEHARIISPLIKSGRAHAVLVIAFERLALLSGPTPAEHKEFSIRIVSQVASRVGIRSIPGPPPQIGRGARVQRPVWNAWTSLGLPDNPKRTIQPASLSLDERLVASSLRGQAAAAQSNVNASWTISDTYLRDLPLLLTRSRLPIDWFIPQNKDEFIDNTYKWTTAKLSSISEPFHRFVIMIALILCKLPPFHVIPNPLPDGLSSYAQRHEVAAYCRNLQFIAKPGGARGHTFQPPFFVMWATLILSLYDPSSPIGELIASGKGLGTKWTKKHGSFCSFPL